MFNLAQLIDGAPVVADLNNPPANKTCRANTATLNGPSGLGAGLNWGLVYTLSTGFSPILTADTATQIYMLTTGNRTFFRRKESGSTSWTAWVEYWNSSNLVVTASALDTTPGRILKVADFGIGAYGAPPSGTNANNYTVIGWWATTASTTNLPPGLSNGVLRVDARSATFIRQTFYSLDTTAINLSYSRTLHNTTWTPWVKELHSGNVLDIGSTAASARSALELKTGALYDAQSSLGDATTGKLVLVGGFGWGLSNTNGITLTNLDTEHIPGQYRYVDGTTLGTPPVAGENGTVLVTTYRNSLSGTIYSEQRFVSYQNGQNTVNVYFRVMNGSLGWSTWVRLLHTANTSITTSQFDHTLGKISKVGDFGIGFMLDRRTQNPTPQDLYGKGLITHFHDAGNINSPGGLGASVYGVSVYNAQYNDLSGLKSITHSFTSDQNQFIRFPLSATAWSPWYRVWNSATLLNIGTTPASARTALELATVASSGSASDLITGTVPIARMPTVSSYLGFTPVQQGTGTSQTTNAVKIGWSALNSLRVSVDSSNIGFIEVAEEVAVTDWSAISVTRYGTYKIDVGAINRPAGIPADYYIGHFTPYSDSNIATCGFVYSMFGTNAFLVRKTGPSTWTVVTLNPGTLAAVARTGSATDLTVGTLAAARLPASGISPGTYGNSSVTMAITVDTYGRVVNIAYGALQVGSTVQAGVVQLSTATNSTSTALAATPSAVKAAYDLASVANADTGVVSGTYGNGLNIPQLTIDGKGKVIWASVEAIPQASTSAFGVVQLYSGIDSTSSTLAATAGAVKAAYDLAASRAPLASPVFTGSPNGPTAAKGTNTTQFATTAFVQAAGLKYTGVTVLTGTLNVTAAHHGGIFVTMNATTRTVNLSLASATPAGTTVTCIGIGGVITINCNAADLIYGTSTTGDTTTTTLRNGRTATFVCDGVNGWYIVNMPIQLGSGYYVLPGRRVFLYGQGVTDAGGNDDITFPITLAFVPFAINCTHYSNAAPSTDPVAFSTHGHSTTGFSVTSLRVVAGAPLSTAVYGWTAIGDY